MTETSSRSGHGHDYIPAFGHDLLLPFYDLFTRALGVRAAHRTLLDLAAPRAGERILEIGCGTGNLTLMAKKRFPDTELVGLDPDPLALARAVRKAGRASLEVRFDRGYSQRLPYPDGSVDRVLSSLMLHHLEGEPRSRTLTEVARVLRPGGTLHLMDIGGQVSASDGFLARMQLRNEHLQHNLGDAIPNQLLSAGFTEVAELTHRPTRFGRVTFYRAGVPLPR